MLVINLSCGGPCRRQLSGAVFGALRDGLPDDAAQQARCADAV
jgi:hypothetical protein